jgi:hypothetical protein
LQLRELVADLVFGSGEVEMTLYKRASGTLLLVSGMSYKYVAMEDSKVPAIMSDPPIQK